MNGENDENLVKQLAWIQSENAHLKALVEEYKLLADAREVAWREMSLKTFNYVPLQSNLEIQTEAIKHLQEQLRKTQQQVEGGYTREHELMREGSSAANLKFENDSLKTSFHYLQSELADMKDQLKRVYNQNVVLQNYVSRIAELESLLSNAEDEIKRLKNKTSEF